MSRRAQQLFFLAVSLVAVGLLGFTFQPEMQGHHVVSLQPSGQFIIADHPQEESTTMMSHTAVLKIIQRHNYLSLTTANVSHPSIGQEEVGGASSVDRSQAWMVPWPRGRCARFRVHFGVRGSLPMTALASFPGSGNTWFRYLLQGATGIFTGSVYRDTVIYKTGFLGELASVLCGCTIVQKTHGFSAMSKLPPTTEKRLAAVRRFGGRAILLLRNPYDAFLAFRNYNYAGHVGHASNRHFQGPSWEDFVTRVSGIWREFAATWINNTLEGLVVHYEDLKEDPRREIGRSLRFLRVPISEERMACVLEHLQGNFKRSTRKMDLRDPYSRKQHLLIDSIIDDVNRMLVSRKWKTLPLHRYSHYKEHEKNGQRLKYLKNAS